MVIPCVECRTYLHNQKQIYEIVVVNEHAEQACPQWVGSPHIMAYAELGFPPPCGAVSTRGIIGFVPGSLEL